MMEKYLMCTVFGLLVLIGRPLLGQDIEALKKDFITTDKDTTYLNIGYEIATLYENSDLDSALYFADLILEKANNPREEIKFFLSKKHYLFYLLKANLLNQYQRYKQAAIYYDKAKEVAKTHNDRYAELNIISGKASMLVAIHDEEALPALEELLSKIDTTQKVEDHRLFVVANFNKAKCLSQSGDYAQAVNILLELLDYPNEQIRTRYYYAILNSLAINLKRSRNYSAAKRYYLMGLENENIPTHYNGMFLYNLASMYYDMIELDSSYVYAMRILDLDKLSTHYSFKANKLISDICFEKNNIDCARSYLREAFADLQGIENVNLHSDYYFSLLRLKSYDRDSAGVFAALHTLDSLFETHPNSFEPPEIVLLKEKGIISGLEANGEEGLVSLFEAYITVRDTLEKKRVDEQIQEALAEYEAEKKDLEIKVLEHENAEKEASLRYFISLSVIALILVGILFYAYWLVRSKNQLMQENEELLTDMVVDMRKANEGLRRTIEELNAPKELSFREKVQLLSAQIYNLRNRNKDSFQFADISWLEAQGNKTIFHTVDQKEYTVWGTLKELIKDLPQDIFLQVHKSFVINMDHIQKMPPRMVVLENNDEVTIGPKFKNDVLARIDTFRKALNKQGDAHL